MNLPKAVPRASGCGSLTEQALSGCFSGLPVSASFDGKQHLRSLPVVNSLGYVLRFLTKLCRSLLCDDLFSHQPFPRGCRASQQAQMEEEGRIKSGKLPPRASHTSLRSPMPLSGHHSTSECASWRAVCLGSQGAIWAGSTKVSQWKEVLYYSFWSSIFRVQLIYQILHNEPFLFQSPPTKTLEHLFITSE